MTIQPGYKYPQPPSIFLPPTDIHQITVLPELYFEVRNQLHCKPLALLWQPKLPVLKYFDEAKMPTEKGWQSDPERKKEARGEVLHGTSQRSDSMTSDGEQDSPGMAEFMWDMRPIPNPKPRDRLTRPQYHQEHRDNPRKIDYMTPDGKEKWPGAELEWATQLVRESRPGDSCARP